MDLEKLKDAICELLEHERITSKRTAASLMRRRYGDVLKAFAELEDSLTVAQDTSGRYRVNSARVQRENMRALLLKQPFWTLKSLLTEAKIMPELWCDWEAKSYLTKNADGGWTWEGPVEEGSQSVPEGGSGVVPAWCPMCSGTGFTTPN